MEKLTIGIVANGPEEALPDLKEYIGVVDYWIGADRGAFHLLEHHVTLDYAIGDFDSVTMEEMESIKMKAKQMEILPAEKDMTDLESALKKAFERKPDKIYMFGVTSGRKDHELINIQLLYRIIKAGIHGKIIDKQNEIELLQPGTYTIEKEEEYPYISFIPFSETVHGLSLQGFYYPLENADLSWGSTLCISNELSAKRGTFSYRQGILMVIKSRDSIRRQA